MPPSALSRLPGGSWSASSREGAGRGADRSFSLCAGPWRPSSDQTARLDRQTRPGRATGNPGRCSAPSATSWLALPAPTTRRMGSALADLSPHLGRGRLFRQHPVSRAPGLRDHGPRDTSRAPRPAPRATHPRPREDGCAWQLRGLLLPSPPPDPSWRKRPAPRGPGEQPRAMFGCRQISTSSSRSCGAKVAFSGAGAERTHGSHADPTSHACVLLITPHPNRPRGSRPQAGSWTVHGQPCDVSLAGVATSLGNGGALACGRAFV